MCCCYSFFSPTKRLLERFPRIEETVAERPPTYRIRPRDEAVVIVADIGRSEQPMPAWMSWGLIPHWAKDETIANKCFNARSETVFVKPAFREAAKYSRCLVPASAYFEWSGPRGKKQPWVIRDPEQQGLTFAGLSSIATVNGETYQTFTILTRPAGKDVAKIHDREPVTLDDRQMIEWMNPAAAQAKLQQILDINRSCQLVAKHAHTDLLTRSPDATILTPPEASGPKQTSFLRLNILPCIII